MQSIQGVGDHRQFQIDGANNHAPGSVFIKCGSFCVEVSRDELVRAMSLELGMLPAEWDFDGELRQLLGT